MILILSLTGQISPRLWIIFNHCKISFLVLRMSRYNMLLQENGFRKTERMVLRRLRATI